MDNMAENGLPEEVWALIAGFSDMEKGLSPFRLASRGLNKVGSIALLHRLRTIDKTLPLIFPQNDAAQFLKQAFQNIQARQQAEITYLTEHHSEHIKQEACLTEHASESPLSLEILEKRHCALDNVNNSIIISKIDMSSNKLDLSFTHITRLPISLFEDDDYIIFWKNLLVLNIRS